MWRIIVTCVDMFYVEGNEMRQNICGANADEILTTIKIYYVQKIKLIAELCKDSEPIMEVISFLDQILMALLIYFILFFGKNRFNLAKRAKSHTSTQQ